MKKIKLNVKGMHCASCEMLVVDSLEELKGVVGAKASHKSGIIEVDFDNSQLDVEEIKKVIKKEGYDVK